MIRRIFPAALFCLLLTFSVSAQRTPAATPDPLNLRVGVDVMFPEGVAFSGSFIQPEAGFESITVYFTQAGWIGDDFIMTPPDVQVNENDVTFSAVWMLSDNPPALFEPLEIIWEVVPVGAPPVRITREIVIADPRETWLIAEPAGLPVRVATTSLLAGDNALVPHLNSLSTLMRAGGRTIPPLNIAIFPARTAIEPCPLAQKSGDELIFYGVNTGLEVPCSVNVSPQKLYAREQWVLRKITLTDSQNYLVTDLILRETYPLLFAGSAAPEWFKAGLVAYFAAGYSTADLVTLQSAVRTNQILPLTAQPDSDAAVRQLRTQQLGIVLYMISQVGVPELLQIMARVEAGDPLATAWQDAAGQPLDAALSAWRNWVFTDAATAIYQQRPGIAPTPTPQPSLTPTPTLTLTPTTTPTTTATPTPTATITPSATATSPGGFGAPTAVPTLTPSASPTVTPTPRAAALFDLNQEIAENAPESGLNPLLLAIGIVWVIILIGIILIIRRRQKPVRL